MKPDRRSSLSIWLSILIFLLVWPLLVVIGSGLEEVYIPLLLKDWPETRLVFSEVLYDTSDAEPDGEWVEFYNVGDRRIDLSDYKFGDEESLGGREGMLRFPVGTIVEIKQTIIVASEAITFEARYGQPPDFEMRESDPAVPNMLKYTAWAGGNVSLDNNGDELLLLNEDNEVVDALSYGDSTFFFDPPAEKAKEDQSLARNPVNQDSDTAADWIVQTTPDPWEVQLGEPTEVPSATASLELTPTPPEPVVLHVSEVLYDPDGAEPDEEWIEIYNPGTEQVNLTGCKVGDEEAAGDGEGMLQFPDGASLASGEVIVIANRADAYSNVYGSDPDYEMNDTDPQVPDMTKYSSWSNGSVALSNSGDDVLILAADDSLVDAVSWAGSTWAFDPPAGDVSEGHSLERVPADQDTDSAADWIDQPVPQPGFVALTTATETPTPTSSATITATGTEVGTETATPTPTTTIEPTPETGRLLVSEVLYDPLGSEPANEWIELHNAGGSVLSLTDLKLGDEETTGQGEGMYRFPEGMSLEPDEVILIANQSVEFEAVYGFKPDLEFIESDAETPNMEKYTEWASGNVGLSNTGDEVIILAADDSVVDAVSWGSSTWAFDPAAPDVVQGHSLARFPAGLDTDSAADWIELELPTPGVVEGSEGWVAKWLARLLGLLGIKQ